MNRIFILSTRIVLIFILAVFYTQKIYADEIDTLLKQLQILQKDIKTLEKAVYSKDVKTTTSANLSDAELGSYLTNFIFIHYITKNVTQ